MRKLIAVAGPTAVGKTKYAIETAKAFNGEIVSCDSMQLYKYMNIGSAKPTPDEQAEVKHWLVDEIDPKEPFSVARYAQMAKAAIEDIFSRGKTPVIEGGTGLYLNSLLYEMDFSGASVDTELRDTLLNEAELFGPEYIYNKLKEADPKAAERIHPNNVKKVIRALEGAISGKNIVDFKNCQEKCKDYDTILIGLTRNRPELYDRINQRVDIMIEEGLFHEVEELLEMGLDESDISMKGIGYKEIIGYFDGLYGQKEAIELIKKNSRHLAKRQLTWFRRYEDTKWFNLSEYESDEAAVGEIIGWVQTQGI